MNQDMAELKNELGSAIEKFDSICILTHKNPDGDGLPASLALQELIRSKGKKADVLLEYEAPPLYDFLAGRQRTKVYSGHFLYDLIIILDCHEIERIGKCAPLLHTAQKIIAIDHHPQRELIKEAYTFIDTKSVSVGTIIFEIFENEMDDLRPRSSKFIAEAIYTTILNDTNNFINANTDQKTFEIVAKLFRYDLVPGEIAEFFLMNKTPDYMRFLGEALSTIQTYQDDQILFLDVKLAMLKRNRLSNEDTSKITSWVKGTKKVKVIVCFQEIRQDRFRLSLRSNVIDVNKIATKYGGGGHQKASGCEIKGELKKIKRGILDDIYEQL